jgi:hypothetical protein
MFICHNVQQGLHRCVGTLLQPSYAVQVDLAVGQLESLLEFRLLRPAPQRNGVHAHFLGGLLPIAVLQ